MLKTSLICTFILAFLSHPLFAVNEKETGYKAKITASTTVKDYPPVNILDGKMKTRWSSEGADEQWILIELTNSEYICGMTIFWETAFARSYSILTSVNDSEWNEVFSENDSDGNTDEIYFKGNNIRFIKLVMHKRATGWGNSIWEIKLKNKAEEPAVSSELKGSENIIDGSNSTAWSGDGKQEHSALLNLKRNKHIGGIILNWGQNSPEAYEVNFSKNGKDWDKKVSVKNGNGGTDVHYFTPFDAEFIKIHCFPGKAFDLQEIKFKNGEEGFSPIRFYKAMVNEYPQGYFPKWLSNKQLYWTIVGVDLGTEESLIAENGSIEPFIKSFTIIPYLFHDEKLITSVQCNPTQELEDDYLPIPSIAWNAPDVDLSVKAFSAGTPQKASTYSIYTVHNKTQKPVKGQLYLTIRPFQINPPWQHGGFSPV